MRAARLCLPLLAGCLAAAAQTLEARFLSEFRRVGASGEIIAADAAGKPREIISPAAIRNGYTSFHLVVKGPPGTPFMLYIASNPDGVLRPALYRVTNADRLEQVKGLSESGKFNEQGAGVYWLDLWTPANTPVRRIRVEAQLNVGRDFVITPLEVRVLAGVVPAQAAPVTRKTGGNSAAGAFALLGQSLCGAAGSGATATGPDPFTVPGKIMRNAGQDMLLARKLGPLALKDTWCAAPREAADPETYLRIRDAIWRLNQ